MTTVWKYPLLVMDELALWMPAGAEVLTVQVQGDQPMLWVAVDPDAPQEPRRFRVVGTGNPVPDVAGRYVGTWQDPPFVWHLFEVTP